MSSKKRSYKLEISHSDGKKVIQAVDILNANEVVEQEAIDHAVRNAVGIILEEINNKENDASRLKRIFEMRIQTSKKKLSFLRFLYEHDALQLINIINAVIDMQGDQERRDSTQSALVNCLSKHLVIKNEFSLSDQTVEPIGLFDWTDGMCVATLTQINELKKYADDTLAKELATSLTKKKLFEAQAIPVQLIDLIDKRGKPSSKESDATVEKLKNVAFKMQLAYTLHQSDKLFHEQRIGGKKWHEIALKLLSCLFLPYGIYRLGRVMLSDWLGNYPTTLQHVNNIDMAARLNAGGNKTLPSVSLPHFRGGQLFQKPADVKAQSVDGEKEKHVALTDDSVSKPRHRSGFL